MPKTTTKTKPSDIIDWLVNAVSEVEADGYQQVEHSEDRWYANGPPNLDSAVGNKMFATDNDGNRFLIKVTKVRR